MQGCRARQQRLHGEGESIRQKRFRDDSESNDGDHETVATMTASACSIRRLERDEMRFLNIFTRHSVLILEDFLHQSRADFLVVHTAILGIRAFGFVGALGRGVLERRVDHGLSQG
jgi:hypothetical protein